MLFMDISGYTELSHRIAREQIIALIERYFSHFLDCIQEEFGDIAELAGDGAMALFHSADPREHARQAARAALRILEVTDRLNLEHPDAGTPIAVHMGLNSSHAGVGSIRLEGALGSRWTFTASGSVTNLAARLRDSATRGTILVGLETARRIAAEFPLQQVDVRPLKNLAERVEGYRLTKPVNHVETTITGVATMHASFPWTERKREKPHEATPCNFGGTCAPDSSHHRWGRRDGDFT